MEDIYKGCRASIMGGTYMGLEDNKRVADFLTKVCGKIRNKKLHNEIRLEFLNHIEELYAENIRKGMSEDMAIEEALRYMGDGDIVGKRLNKIHRQWPDWAIIGGAALLAVFGVILMYLIEANGALSRNNGIFKDSIFHVLLGLATLLGLNLFDYRILKKYSKYIYGATIIAWLFFINTGAYVNGQLYFIAGRLSFMPMVIVPLIVSLAGLFDGWDWNDKKRLIIAAGLVLLPVLLFLRTYSMAYVIVYFVSVLLILFASGLKLKQVIPVFVLAGVVSIFFLVQRSYILERVLTFLNPWNDPNGAGWIHIQMGNLIKSAGIFGKGFEFDPMLLPSVDTDFVFAYVIYTFGWLITGILVAAIALFIARMIKGVGKVTDSYGKLVAVGFIGILSTRFIWNILMTLGLLPITGLPFPFISYGGTQLVMDMVMVGYLSNIYRRKEKAYSETVI